VNWSPTGLMIPLHTMTGGDESAYRLTEAASPRQPSLILRSISLAGSLTGNAVSGPRFSAASWLPPS